MTCEKDGEMPSASIALSPTEFERVTDLVESPPEPTPALRELMTPTFTMAKPEEVVEFVERKRIKLGERPSGTLTIVAVAPPEPTRAKCEWENCIEPSTAQWRWRREAADGVNDKFDHAVYCEGHGMMASTHGAVLKERF